MKKGRGQGNTPLPPCPINYLAVSIYIIYSLSISDLHLINKLLRDESLNITKHGVGTAEVRGRKR